MKKIRQLLHTYDGLDPQIYFISLSKLVNAMGALVFPFLTFILNSKIGMSDSEAGAFISYVGIIQGGAFLIGGKLADTVGRKKVIIFFEFLAMLFFGSCIFIEPSVQMTYLIVGACVCYGLATPAHDAMIADLSNGDNRQAAFSLGYLAFNLGFIIAQITAAFLFTKSLKLIFLIDVVTTFISLVIMFFFVKESIHRTGDEQSSELEKKEKGSVLPILFKRPILIYFAVVVILFKFMYSQWSFLIPLHATANFGEAGATKLYGFLGVFNALIVVSLTPVLTHLTKGLSNIRRVIMAGITFTIGFGLLGVYSTYVAFFLCVLIFTLGEILEAISVVPFIMNHCPASHRGRISALMPIIMGTGYAVGPMIMGQISDSRGYSFSWLFIAVLGIIGVVLMMGVDLYDRKSKAH